jgi:hypothetical protein
MDLYELVRQAAYASLRKRPRTEVFVMTNALCKNSSRELKARRDVVELATSRNVLLVPIVLEAAADEIVRRLQSAVSLLPRFEGEDLCYGSRYFFVSWRRSARDAESPHRRLQGFGSVVKKNVTVR